MTAVAPDAPIGVFDSGIGGLSVLAALRQLLPYEQFVYIADSAHTPYGERGDDFVAARTARIAQHLRSAHGVKLLVIACNTASAAAVREVRRANPGWPVVAIEPALKPAAAQSRTGHVGVLATRGTLASGSYAALRAQLAESRPDMRFVDQPCDGLAAAIEQWALSGDGTDARALLAQHLAPLGAIGVDAPAIDTLVLGCTHYPLIRDAISDSVPAGVTLVDAGAPVARQTHRLLHATGLLREAQAGLSPSNGLRLIATGGADVLRAAAQRWLSLHEAAVEQVALD